MTNSTPPSAEYADRTHCCGASGVGEKKALQLVQKFGDMKDIMGSLEGGKYVVPEPFPYEEARKLFKGAHDQLDHRLPVAFQHPGPSCDDLKHTL